MVSYKDKIKVMIKVVKRELVSLVKFLLVVGLIGMLSSCGSSNGLVKGPGMVCRNGVCSMYK